MGIEAVARRDSSSAFPRTRSRSTTVGSRRWRAPSPPRKWPVSRPDRCRGRMRPGRRSIACSSQFGEADRIYSRSSGGLRRVQQCRFRDPPQCLARRAVHAAGGRGYRLGAPRRRPPAGRSSTSRTAAVFHSHHENARAQALRMIDINRVLDDDDRPRSRRRTIREAAGILARDAVKILGLDEPFGGRLSTSASSYAWSATTSSTSPDRGRRRSADVEQRSPDLGHSRRWGSI